MKIEIDIIGQIQQLNYDSALGFRRENGFEKSVFLRSKDKKEIIKKYKGLVTDLIENIDQKRILWEKQDLIRHDPEKLADSICRIYTQLSLLRS